MEHERTVREIADALARIADERNRQGDTGTASLLVELRDQLRQRSIDIAVAARPHYATGRVDPLPDRTVQAIDKALGERYIKDADAPHDCYFVPVPRRWKA